MNKFNELYNMIMEDVKRVKGEIFIQQGQDFTEDHLNRLLLARDSRTKNHRDPKIGEGMFRLKEDADAKKIAQYIDKKWKALWETESRDMEPIYQAVFSRSPELRECWTEGDINKLPDQHSGKHPTPKDFRK